MNKEQFKGFVNSYLGTAAWVTCDRNECTEFTRAAKKQAETDCQKFIDMVTAAFPETYETILLKQGNEVPYLAPHDFFLTRNGHGAGFWDKAHYYGEDTADKLTQISKEIGSVDCYHLRGPKSKLTFN